jgi:hypothetical protein
MVNINGLASNFWMSDWNDKTGKINLRGIVGNDYSLKHSENLWIKDISFSKVEDRYICNATLDNNSVIWDDLKSGTPIEFELKDNFYLSSVHLQKLGL